jgi:Tfp pilus assembly protein PilN
MKSLDERMSPIRLDMMPKEIISGKKAKKQLFIMVNIAASVLLLMLMYISFLINESRNVSLEMSQMRQCQQNVDLEQLAREQADMSSNLQRTTDNVNSIKAVFGNKVWHNWAFMLAELSKNTPPAVHIQELQANSSSMSIEGLAVSYDAINDFVGKLGLCKFIRSAQLADTKQNIRYGGGMLDYSISCSLANDKEVKKD